MRNIRRLPLPPHAVTWLGRWTASLPDELSACVDAKARREWLGARWNARRRTKAMRQVRETLHRMNDRLTAHCMYCEYNEATHLDHHEPRHRAPERLFDWLNLVLACDVCDSVHKGGQFEDPATGVVILDPTGSEPIDSHFGFDSLGRVVVRSPRGAWTVQVFGLARTALSDARAARWQVLTALLPLYAAELRGGNTRRAGIIADTIRRGALRSVLRDLITASLSPGAVHANLASVARAVRAHPEVREWAAGAA